MIDVNGLVKLDSSSAVRQTGTDLRNALDKINTRAENVKTTWSGLAAHYKAPEQADVLTAMNVPVTASDALAGHGLTVKNALHTYADTLDTLRSRKSSLISDINTFYADKTRIENENRDNNIAEDIKDFFTGESNDLLNRENALNSRAAQLQADKDAAERTCANAIGDIWGGEHYEAADETTVDDTTTYGFTSRGYESMSMSGDAPWGHPEMWSSGNWSVRAQMIGEGAWSSVTGTVTFFGDLTGFNGGGRAGAAWSGLGQLAMDAGKFANPFSIAAGFATDPQGQLDSGERLLGVGKGIIGWDNWDTSGWQTGGSVGLDVILTVATGGAGGAVKGSIRAASASRFVRFVSGTSRIDVAGTAAAMRVRLASSLNTRLGTFTEMGTRLNERLGLQPALAGVPDIPRTTPHASVPHHETPHSGPVHDTTPDVPARASTHVPDAAPARDPAGREYRIDDNGHRHVEGDPGGTHRDQNGRLHETETGQFTRDTNPAEVPEGDRARFGETTEPTASPEAQANLDALARDREGFRTARDNAARTVDTTAREHGINPDDLRTTRQARENLASMVREGKLSPDARDSIFDAVRQRDTAANNVRTTSQTMGEQAARDLADARGEHTIVDGTGAGSGRADQVTVGDHPPRITVYEAKGGASPLGPGRAGNQQGSAAYLDDLLSRDPNVSEGLQRFVEENPDSPTAAAIRDGSIEIRYELVEARPYTSADGRPTVRTRVTELIVHPDRVQLPDLDLEGTR